MQTAHAVLLCQREQTRCKLWLERHGHDDPGASYVMLGASDWLMEEIFLMLEKES